jgi:hypothetical protein
LVPAEVKLKANIENGAKSQIQSKSEIAIAIDMDIVNSLRLGCSRRWRAMHKQQTTNTTSRSSKQQATAVKICNRGAAIVRTTRPHRLTHRKVGAVDTIQIQIQIQIQTFRIPVPAPH